MTHSTISSNLLFSLLVMTTLIGFSKSMFPLNRRLTRSLPSVSDDHYQESASDGSYRYAYTGENRYTAERRLPDGTVEGETLHIRPDGVPIKVHYFADNYGYRPKTEILYEERILVPEPPRRAKVLEPPPALYLAPPAVRERVVKVPVPVEVPVAVPYAVKPDDSSTSLRIEGSSINIGNTNGGETAIANPSVTAIVGPGGRAELRPEGYASTRSGGTAISNPSTSAVVGPGGSVVLAPSARATTNELDSGVTTVRTYSNQNAQHVFVPEVTAVRTSGVLVVPSSPSYSYEYSYSAPDNQNPSRDNKAFVAVRVNS